MANVHAHPQRDLLEDGVKRTTEIILPSSGAPAEWVRALVWQRLADADSGWLCWVGRQPVRRVLGDRLRARAGRLLQVLPRQRGSSLELACRALSSGTSHTVVIYLEPGEDLCLRSLERAAATGNSECFVLRHAVH